jgi:hypothetical protein
MRRWQLATVMSILGTAAAVAVADPGSGSGSGSGSASAPAVDFDSATRIMKCTSSTKSDYATLDLYRGLIAPKTLGAAWSLSDLGIAVTSAASGNASIAFVHLAFAHDEVEAAPQRRNGDVTGMWTFTAKLGHAQKAVLRRANVSQLEDTIALTCDSYGASQNI